MKSKLNIVRSIVVITFLLFYTMNLCGQTSPQISFAFIIYDNAGGQKTLSFGLDQTATSGIDFDLGESELPPYPPTGAFDARWFLPENNFNGSLSSWKDYRHSAGFPFVGTVEYRFRYQSAAGATAMFVNWDLPQTVTGLIQDLLNGTIINVPISGNGIYQINNFDAINTLKLLIYYNNVVSVDELDPQFPSKFKLGQNFPNPFNPSTVISWQSPVDSRQTIKIYDILGSNIATLVDEYKPAGRYQTSFNASALSSGIYFYTLQAGSYRETKKMILIR